MRSFPTRRRITALLAAAMVVTVAGTAVAQEAGETVVKRGALGEDQYLAGRTVQVLADVRGDVLAAGASVTVSGSVAGDVAAAGRQVMISGEVADDVRAVGADVIVSGSVGDHAVLAGRSVDVAPASEIGGRLWAAGAQVKVSGQVAGDARLAGGNVLIAGRIEGDVRVAADRLEVVSGAVITGTLRVAADTELELADGARVAGGVERLPAGEVVEMDPPGDGPLPAIISLLVLAFSAWLLWMLLPRAVTAVLDRLHDRPLLSIGVGVIALLVTLPLAVLLLVTVLAAPLGLALLVAYPLLLLGSVLAGGTGIGVLLMGVVGRDAGVSWLARAATAAGGFVVLGLVSLVPLVGALLWLLALFAGAGALTGAAWRRARRVSA